jgi:antitoxin YefM
MNVVPFSEAQANLDSLIDAVCKSSAPVRIKRENGEDVVLLPLSEYGSMEETLYLLGSENNARNLWESIAQFRGGEIVRHEPFENDQQEGGEPPCRTA